MISNLISLMLKKANSLEIKKNMISNEKPLKTIAITKTKSKDCSEKKMTNVFLYLKSGPKL